MHYMPNNSKTVKTLATLLMILLLNAVVSGYIAYRGIQSVNRETTEQTQYVQDTQWQFIEGIIIENMDKAKIQADGINASIERRVSIEYGVNTTRLSVDLNAARTPPKLYSILDGELKNKYINVVNDNNDPFVANFRGVISDNSLNCATPDGQRTWNEEYIMHANPTLAKRAVGMILAQSPDIKIWEFLKSKNESHRLLATATMEDIKDIYYTEGLSGLETYEVLTPSYIRGDRDMLNVPDVVSGVKHDNGKLIVVQGFSITDALIKHRDKLDYFKYQQKIIDEGVYYKKSMKAGELFFTVILLAITFVSVMTLMNAVERGGAGCVRNTKL